ncbi:MAG: GreA/GreB family elongation factor [Ferruginibacter sp.]
MSRGFVKEDDQEEIPFVPPRADLPEGATNYVTQFGMDSLLKEKETLIKERESLDSSNVKDYRISANHINAQLQLISERIGTAKIIEADDQLSDEVRFGTTVTLKIKKTNKIQKFQIVGVDEADIKKNKIAFTAPIAKILIHKKVGEIAVLKLHNEERIFEILKVELV